MPLHHKFLSEAIIIVIGDLFSIALKSYFVLINHRIDDHGNWQGTSWRTNELFRTQMLCLHTLIYILEVCMLIDVLIFYRHITEHNYLHNRSVKFLNVMQYSVANIEVKIETKN